MLSRFVQKNLFWIIILAVVGLYLLSPKEKTAPAPTGQVSASTSGVKAGDFAPGQLQAHFTKHGYQFGSISEEDYLEDARKILNAPVGGDIAEKVRENGDIERYNHHTHEFAVMTKTGRIRTYFIAKDEGYWDRQ